VHSAVYRDSGVTKKAEIVLADGQLSQRLFIVDPSAVALMQKIAHVEIGVRLLDALID